MLLPHVTLLAEEAHAEEGWSLFWPVVIGGGSLVILLLALIVVVSIGAGREHS